MREINHYYVLKLCMNIICVNSHIYYSQLAYIHQIFIHHSGISINEGHHMPYASCQCVFWSADCTLYHLMICDGRQSLDSVLVCGETVSGRNTLLP